MIDTGGRINDRNFRTATAVASLPVMPSFLLGALSARIQEDIRFSYVALGMLVSASYMAAAVTAGVFGRRLDQKGASWGVRVSAGLLAASCMAIGIFSRTVFDLAVLMALTGVAAGIGQPTSNLMLANNTPRGRQGFAFGLKQAAIPSTAFLAGMAVPLANELVGWRTIFVLLSACACGVALLGHSDTAAALDGVPGPRQNNRVAPVALVPLLLLSFAGLLGGAAVSPLAVFVVSSALEIGVPLNKAGLILAGSSAAAVVVRVWAGWLADIRAQRHLVFVSHLLALGACGFLVLATTTNSLVFAAGAVLAGAAGWGWSGVFSFGVINSQRHAPAAASSITQSGMFVGAAIGAPMFGLILEHYSYSAAWGLAALLLFIAVGLVRWGRRRLRAALLPRT